MFRGLDILTIKWATGDLREECRFLLNTQRMFLKKEKDRFRSSSMTTSGSARWRKRKKTQPTSQRTASCMVSKTLTPRKFVPFRRESSCGKYVSRRLLARSEGEIAGLTTSIRQIGVGTPFGAEALAIFHQLLYDEWMTGSLSGPLLWDDRVEGGARGGDVVSLQHTAAAAWKHRNVSFVEQALAYTQGSRGGRR